MTAAPVPTAPADIDRPLVAWLLACCVLVFAMIVVDSVTRLTHSGLSITEWQPIVGAIPPLSDRDWQDAFAKYRATPEYRLVNHGMSLADFKGIFWWEYAHRLLGRLIGLAYLLPLLWFWWRGRIPSRYGAALAAIFVLGGLQGAMGWYMVKSGLVDDPRVSQFRLTAHLAIAFAILGATWWLAQSLRHPRGAETAARDSASWRIAAAVVALVALMVATGGIVAGIRAGFAYNTFPLMNGALVPPEILMLEPWWRNFFWNMATVQFDHRIGAYALVVAVAWLWRRVARDPGCDRRSRAAVRWLAAALAVQVALGIATLLLVVPVPLAAMHQGGAAIVFVSALNTAHALSRADVGPASRNS